jgi:hypothetical protein
MLQREEGGLAPYDLVYAAAVGQDAPHQVAGVFGRLPSCRLLGDEALQHLGRVMASHVCLVQRLEG